MIKMIHHQDSEKCKLNRGIKEVGHFPGNIWKENLPMLLILLWRLKEKILKVLLEAIRSFMILCSLEISINK